MPWLLLLLSATTCANGQVRSSGPGHVSLKVVAAPLAGVLECLSEATGVEVVYDGVTAPPARVTVSAEDAAISDALDLLLARQPLKYALAIDPKGKEGGVLIISAGTAAKHGGAPVVTAAPTSPPWDPEGPPPAPDTAPATSPNGAATAATPPPTMGIAVGTTPDGAAPISPPSAASPNAMGTAAPPPALPTPAPVRSRMPPVYPEPLSLTRTTR